MTCTRLETRDVPAIYGVTFTGPTDDTAATITGTIQLQAGVAAPSGVEPLAGEVFVDVADSEATIFAAVRVTNQVSWQGKSDTYTFSRSTTTRNSASHPNREAYALTQSESVGQPPTTSNGFEERASPMGPHQIPAARVTAAPTSMSDGSTTRESESESGTRPEAWNLGLEDLSEPSLRELGPDGDADWDYNDRTWKISVRMTDAVVFKVREVTFDPGKALSIWSDDGQTAYDDKHWLDLNVNGKIDAGQDHQYPVLCVKDEAVKVKKLVIDTQNSKLDPAQYKARGEVTFKGQPKKLTLVSRPGAAGSRDGQNGSNWIFSGLTDAANTFANVSYDPEMSIEWTVEKLDGTKLWEGTTENPGYVSFKAVDKQQEQGGFKMLRTFVHLGSADAKNVTDPDKVIEQVWSKFKDAKLKTFDDQALVYYKD